MNIRYAWLAAAGLAVAGCGVGDKVGDIPADSAQSKLIQPDCYTVDPYVPPKIAKPRSDVPEEMRAFLGKWGGGAWDGRVCHDLYVLQVEPTGTVVMFDAHGPGFRTDATAFTRRGEIGEDGGSACARATRWWSTGSRTASSTVCASSATTRTRSS